jgi:hypothetical protein
MGNYCSSAPDDAGVE